MVSKKDKENIVSNTFLCWYQPTIIIKLLLKTYPNLFFATGLPKGFSECLDSKYDLLDFKFHYYDSP